MTTFADRTIAALRTRHDTLASLVKTFDASRLTGPSGASEWTVAQVLSHLGSGAEIGLGTYRAALEGAPVGGEEFNRGVWARWDAMAPEEQAAGFLEHDARLVGAIEALTPEQRETAKVAMGFLPEPLPLASYAGMRLSETLLHGWDVEVALDPAATLDAAAAQVLAEHYAGALGFLVGFVGKADALDAPAVVVIQDTPYSLTVGDGLALTTTAPDPTASFSGPLESAIRLIGGRLAEEHTPSGTDVTGNVSLSDLRRVFPGF